MKSQHSEDVDIEKIVKTILSNYQHDLERANKPCRLAAFGIGAVALSFVNHGIFPEWVSHIIMFLILYFFFEIIQASVPPKYIDRTAAFSTNEIHQNLLRVPLRAYEMSSISRFFMFLKLACLFLAMLLLIFRLLHA